MPAQARVVYHFSVSLASALPTEASVKQRPAEGAERRLKPSSITEAAAGGSAAYQKNHMAHSSQNRDGVFRARAHVKLHLVLRSSRKELQPAAACSSIAFSIQHSPGLSPTSCLGSSLKPCCCFKQVLVDAGVAAAAASQKVGISTMREPQPTAQSLQVGLGSHHDLEWSQPACPEACMVP